VTVYVPFAWIIEAKLVLSDELMKRGAEEREARLQDQSLESSEDEE
jgi:ribosome maturation factor RimP